MRLIELIETQLYLKKTVILAILVQGQLLEHHIEVVLKVVYEEA
jgi:hypothetical protein